ncbi:MAG TPA: GNAT family N-acetyltransferase [Nocardioidaceae bacterium]|nr:GNAT family N-acetyltransferase [Nocardioidaceae bacterium]
MTNKSDVRVPPFEVRLARPAESGQICEVCTEGFTASSVGILPPETILRQAGTYYSPARVRGEVESAGATRAWQGYVVAVNPDGRVLGAAGGGVREGQVGQVYVLYLRTDLRGCGIGTALLDFVTEQQRRAGAREQWVSVTEGNDLGIPFYLARGFVERDRVPFVDGTWSLRMVRPL